MIITMPLNRSLLIRMAAFHLHEESLCTLKMLQCGYGSLCSGFVIIFVRLQLFRAVLTLLGHFHFELVRMKHFVHFMSLHFCLNETIRALLTRVEENSMGKGG